MKNILILGCNGMAGHMVSLYLQEQGYKVLGMAREKSALVDSVVGDALDTDFLGHLIMSNHFDVIVNCIGVLNQDAENHKANAVYLNSFLPHYLSEVTKDQKTKIIHISTDCVFSGQKGNYSEYDTPDGNTFYDRTKALGELVDDKNLTLRQSIVGPDLKKGGIGLLNWFMQQEKTVNGYTGALWTGQTTLQLAKTIEYAINNDSFGLYNVVPEKNISKYELLSLFNKYLRNSPIEIIPVDSVNVNKSLVRVREGFDYPIPNYETMVLELSEWMKKHASLYPHYELKL